jgi:multidrug efflux pump subunit AcrA (membrane-fusion protein)
MRSSGSGVFRDRALEQGDIREALDERVRIVGVPRWIALAIGVVIVLGFIAWSASKDIETSVKGGGIIAPQQGVHLVASPVAGTVVSAPPGGGTPVRAGQILATIDTGHGAPVKVTSLFAGTIDNVSAAPGAFVNAGGQIATIEPAGATPAALLFVPASQASQLKVGMQALLSPSLNQSRATALLKGRIQRIATYPASPAELNLILGAGLASQLANGPAVQEVQVALVPDRSTPSGYAWTQGKGPSSVRIGAPLSGRVVLSRNSPLSHVF